MGYAGSIQDGWSNNCEGTINFEHSKKMENYGALNSLVYLEKHQRAYLVFNPAC